MVRRTRCCTGEGARTGTPQAAFTPSYAVLREGVDAPPPSCGLLLAEAAFCFAGAGGSCCLTGASLVGGAGASVGVRGDDTSGEQAGGFGLEGFDCCGDGGGVGVVGDDDGAGCDCGCGGAGGGEGCGDLRGAQCGLGGGEGLFGGGGLEDRSVTFPFGFGLDRKSVV